MKLKFVFTFLVFSLLFVSLVSAAEYQLKKSSELRVGDVIIDSHGNEIVVESVEFVGPEKENFVYEKSKSLTRVLWEKVVGEDLPEKVVSGGSSNVGLSLGESGVGIRVISGEAISELPQKEIKQERKTFWQKLMFWRGNE